MFKDIMTKAYMTEAAVTKTSMTKTMMGKIMTIQDGEFQSLNGKALNPDHVLVQGINVENRPRKRKIMTAS